ncbi:MAG TPA: hypothetical protein VGY77_07475 [Gemmataceae bacterium]|nr:hypothetical protein [Gemmataceae bacterium]
MNLPIQFPREADTIYEDARAYRSLPPTDRLLVIIDLIASGMTILAQSPQGNSGLSLQQAQEAEWQRIQRELFARHGY